MALQTLPGIFPRNEFPLRAKTVFDVFDDLDGTGKPLMRAHVVVFYQRPLETHQNQPHGFFVTIDFFRDEHQEHFVYAVVQRLARKEVYFVPDHDLVFRTIEREKFLASADEAFERSHCLMRAEAFLGRNFPAGIASAEWKECQLLRDEVLSR